MFIKVLIMFIAVAGCLGFGALAAVSVHELFLCGDNFQYKSLVWIVAVISILLVGAFFYLGVWLCNVVLSDREDKGAPDQCKD